MANLHPPAAPSTVPAFDQLDEGSRLGVLRALLAVALRDECPRVQAGIDRTVQMLALQGCHTIPDGITCDASMTPHDALHMAFDALAGWEVQASPVMAGVVRELMTILGGTVNELAHKLCPHSAHRVPHSGTPDRSAN